MLAEHHFGMLAASGITREHAEARGYETISDPRRLAMLGVAKAGQRTRGLLVPQLRVDGSTWGYQYRPDHPRERNGRTVKYETPTGQRNGLDAPPGVGPLLGDPSVPLFITEGVKKADCGYLHGLCIVALPGVWSWRGTNAAGGKTAIPDFHDIALGERRVILAFDGDVARKPAVRRALGALADYLGGKGANVEHLHLPDTDDKTGLDDYLVEHSVGELWSLVRPEMPPEAVAPPPTVPGPEPTPDSQSVEPDGSLFIDPHDGLLARDLARQVTRGVTCGYNPLEQQFYVYDGGVWRHNDDDIESTIAYWLGNRYRQAHCRNVMDLIRFDLDTARIDCEPTPDWINTRSGMVRWRDGTLHAHAPEYRSTVQLPVEYDPNADCPEFVEFIRSVLPEDCWTPTGDSPGFIWELIAYTLYAGNPLHIAVLLYGDGRNGKGSLIRVLKRLIGDNNASTATLHELAENRFRAATLYGKLANLAGDLDSKWLSSTAMFKAITGGDSIQGEHKYGAAFDFAPWALPFYSTNRAFGSADSSEGWVARWLIVPFPNSFLGRQDPHLDTRIGAEGELRGILRRAVDALPVLMNRGRFWEPASVQAAKREFITASDAVRAWLDETCTLDGDAWTPRTELYESYAEFTDESGGKRLSAREFYQRIEQIGGITARPRQGQRGFAGVRKRHPWEDVADAETPDDSGAEGAEGASSPTPTRVHGKKGIEPAPSAPRPGSGSDLGAETPPNGSVGADISGTGPGPDDRPLVCVDCASVAPVADGRRCETCTEVNARVMALYE